jgi:hypothetical protein
MDGSSLRLAFYMRTRLVIDMGRFLLITLLQPRAIRCVVWGLVLEAGIVGTFQHQKVIQVMGIKKTHELLLLIPVGYKE